MWAGWPGVGVHLGRGRARLQAVQRPLEDFALILQRIREIGLVLLALVGVGLLLALKRGFDPRRDAVSGIAERGQQHGRNALLEKPVGGAARQGCGIVGHHFTGTGLTATGFTGIGCTWNPPGFWLAISRKTSLRDSRAASISWHSRQLPA